MSNQKKLEIMPLEEHDRGVAAYLMIYSKFNELVGSVRKIETGAAAIKSGIIVKKFYKAVYNGKIVGIASLSDTRSRYLELNYDDVKKQVGIIKAKKIYSVLENIFDVKNIPDGCAYITFPVSSEGDADYVVKALLEYIFSLKKYTEYYTYISKFDSEKRKILEEIGFRVIEDYSLEKASESNKKEADCLLMKYSERF